MILLFSSVWPSPSCHPGPYHGETLKIQRSARCFGKRPRNWTKSPFPLSRPTMWLGLKCRVEDGRWPTLRRLHVRVSVEDFRCTFLHDSRTIWPAYRTSFAKWSRPVLVRKSPNSVGGIRVFYILTIRPRIKNLVCLGGGWWKPPTSMSVGLSCPFSNNSGTAGTSHNSGFDRAVPSNNWTCMHVRL